MEMPSPMKAPPAKDDLPDKEVEHAQTALVSSEAEEMVNGYGQQASAEEIKEQLAKAAKVQAERKEKRMQAKQGKSTLHRTKTAPASTTTGVAEMLHRSKTELGHRLTANATPPPGGSTKSKAPRAALMPSTESLMGLAQIGAWMLCAAVVAVLCQQSSAMQAVPLFVPFLLMKYAVNFKTATAFAGESTGSFKGVAKALGNIRQVAPSWSAITSGAMDTEAMQSMEGAGGMASGLQDAMAAYSHLKLMYSTAKDMWGQFCLFLIVFCGTTLFYTDGQLPTQAAAVREL